VQKKNIGRIEEKNSGKSAFAKVTNEKREGKLIVIYLCYFSITEPRAF
jgi:hypothetical protein